MKTCNEMAESVIRRRDAYRIEQKKRKKALLCAGLCLCLALGCVGAWHGMKKDAPIDTMEVERDAGSDLDGVSYDIGENTDEEEISETDSVMSPLQTGDEDPSGESIRQMISNYKTENAEISADFAPNPGYFWLSPALEGAMEEYGDTVRYRVRLYLNTDKSEVMPDSEEAKAEMDRLYDVGYTVAYEDFFDGEEHQHLITLHAEYDQLKNFNASPDYGYMLYLYEEGAEASEEQPPAEFHGGME